MIILRPRPKPIVRLEGQARVSLARFFRKAIIGYKKVGMGKFGHFNGIGYPKWPGGFQQAGPAVKISEIKAEKLVLGEENKGIPILTNESRLLNISGEPEYNLKELNISYDVIFSDDILNGSISWDKVKECRIYKLHGDYKTGKQTWSN